MEVVKFGGSSMATADNIRRCADIVGAKSGRRAVVVSAPGKFGSYTEKVTDQLIAAAAELKGGASPTLLAVLERFETIGRDLLPTADLISFKIDLYKTKNEIANRPDDYGFIVSRGEFLTAKLFALYLGFNFVDAADVLAINSLAQADLDKTRDNIKKQRIKKKMPFVIGGFYGRGGGGQVALFSRGGSDYTGAVLAVLLRAKIYENFTDTNGIQTADPHRIGGTKTIPCLDFDALDILTHNGAGVIHESVAKLLQTFRVPLKVDNTFAPNKIYTEVHSPKCKKAACSFFSITHKNNQIVIVSKKKKNGAGVCVQTVNTTPDTVRTDIEKLHSEMLQDVLPEVCLFD